jgi:hypothetical protein
MQLPEDGVRQSTTDWRLACFETAWIFLLFFLVAGSPPPDVGESHYLVKAKHYWQPQWCPGDLFLNSRDAHQTFYWTFGWTTRLVPLEAAAWLGRVMAWGLLAWSWRRLSWAVVPRPLAALLSAAWFLLLLRNFHLAGEWVVGGIEAKALAYVLVFQALEAMIGQRWPRALLLAGGAGAFHVLVGGWTAVALAIAWLLAGRQRPPLREVVPAALAGLALALPGLWPAISLDRGVDADTLREAMRIYVFERLDHHLVYHRFPMWQIARWQLLVAAWLGVWWWRRHDALLNRVQRVVAGAVAIAVTGIALDQSLVLLGLARQWSELEFQQVAAPLLRYYWFRLADALVPVGVALGLVGGVVALAERRPRLAGGAMIAAVLLAGLNVADVVYWRQRYRLPGAIMQPRPTAESWPKSWFDPRTWADEARLAQASSAAHAHPAPPAWLGAERDGTLTDWGSVRSLRLGPEAARQWFDDWRAVCRWIAEHTPPDAVFITPREQQTFKWYAGRAEVVNFKDVPQDAASLLEWKRRLEALYPRDPAHRQFDLAAFTDAELIALARRYGAAYLVVDSKRAMRRIGLPRLYPAVREDNPSFEVYRVAEVAP